MATKKKINAREARREQALADIVNGMAGAFGDYIRSRMAQQPQAQPMMQPRGPMPMAAPPPTEGPLGASMGAAVPSSGWSPLAGDGTGGAPLPLPMPPLRGAPPARLDGGGPYDWSGYFGSFIPDPGFSAPNVPTPPMLPARDVFFEDGSVATEGGQFDPGFNAPWRRWLREVLPTMMPPGRRF